jgi:hypothetical protein
MYFSGIATTCPSFREMYRVEPVIPRVPSARILTPGNKAKRMRVKIFFI